MKKLLIAAIPLFLTLHTYTQQLNQIALPVTDYIVEAGDSVTVVQVILPQGLSIKQKTYGLVRSVFNNPGDTVITVGSGRCQLIKGEYYYYGLLKKYMPRKPLPGELLYTDVNTPQFYAGTLFNAIRHSLIINSVQGGLIANLTTVMQFKSPDDEIPLLTKLQEDVKFTGKVMNEENNNQNMVITEGKFKTQKLFAAMQTVTVADVKYFLEYINARPEKYAGHAWKFSEIMATWMVAGAPTVK
jgi:hypothetical protein